jgi:hypothetical protein
MLGELKKMTLTGYQNDRFDQPTGDVYTAVVNPETYTLNYEIQSNQEQASGTSANQPVFNRIAPRKLEFEFLFDSTGALQQTGLALPLSVGTNQGVWDQVEQFKKTVFYYNGSTHQPPFVILEWGKLRFKCKLEKVSVTYKLFKPDGTPIRAVAKASFVETTNDDLRVAQENARSPDLTHVRTVQAGDNLPLLCHRIYGDATLYGEVARVNHLINFRTLTVGQQLFFPPIEKTANSKSR